MYRARGARAEEQNRSVVTRTQWRRSIGFVVVCFLIGTLSAYYEYREDEQASRMLCLPKLDSLIRISQKPEPSEGRLRGAQYAEMRNARGAQGKPGEGKKDAAYTPQGRSQKTVLQLKLKRFDPNTVRAEELISMGLSQRMVDGFIRHREAKRLRGYAFQSVEEFRSYREIPKHVDDALAPYIHIAKRLHPFDPNVVTSEELIAFGIGISKKRAEAFVRYRAILLAKGKGFRTVEDFNRVRVIPEKQDSILREYIRIGE